MSIFAIPIGKEKKVRDGEFLPEKPRHPGEGRDDAFRHSVDSMYEFAKSFQGNEYMESRNE